MNTVPPPNEDARLPCVVLTLWKPGIGTYVETRSVSLHTSVFTRFSSWYQKAKDSAVGTSFDEHVMGGYKFLMRYYSTGDGGQPSFPHR